MTTPSTGVRPATDFSSSTMNSSPRPTGTSAGTQKPMTSTSDHVSRTTSLSRAPSSVRGLCRPGVSITISCASGRCRMPRIACRVVCGRDDVIAIFEPISALVSVDLPAFGAAKPTKARPKPDPGSSGIAAVSAHASPQDLAADRQGGGGGGRGRVEDVQHRAGAAPCSANRKSSTSVPSGLTACARTPAPAATGPTPGRRAASAGSAGPSPPSTATGASRRTRSASAASRCASMPG